MPAEDHPLPLHPRADGPPPFADARPEADAEAAPDAAAAPPPFPEHLLPAAVNAAATLWEPLAARAWAETARRGRGLLTLRWEELRAAADAARAAADRGEPPPDPPATWIPVTIVSRGDDFRGLLNGYDPHRQVMLLIAHEDGGEAVFGLECDGDRRPAPEVCHARRASAADPSPGTRP